MSYQIWSDQEEILLKQLVADGKHSYRQMGVYFPGRSPESLRGHARCVLDISNDIYKPHKYTFNERFFHIPNPINSYWAGYLAADGSIATPLNVRPKLRLELGNLDLEHLILFKKTLGYNGVIAPGGNKGTSYVQITITEDYMDDLALNFGVIPRKAHHLSPPKLEGLANRVAFLAGLLDGDGCVHISVINNLSVSYVSASVTAVEWYKEIMTELRLPSLRAKKEPRIHKESRAEAYRLTYVGAKAIALVKVMQALKRDLGIPILDRKWDNPCLNQYIADFHTRFPQFAFTPPDFAALTV